MLARKSCTAGHEGRQDQDLLQEQSERSDCNNYRGISLLSIVGVLYSGPLDPPAEAGRRCLPESQCGFRADMVFSLRQLQEKCKEQDMPLFIVFIDLTKVFDLVSRDDLFKGLQKIGCPPRLQSMIESFHTNIKGIVQFNSSSSRSFDLRRGVKQAASSLPQSLGFSSLCS